MHVDGLMNGNEVTAVQFCPCPLVSSKVIELAAKAAFFRMLMLTTPDFYPKSKNCCLFSV